MPVQRRGTVYIMVLGITTLVMAIGVGAALNARSSLDRQRDAKRLMAADTAARAGLELAFASINNYPSGFPIDKGKLTLPTEYGDFALALEVRNADDSDRGMSLNRLKLTVLAQGSGVKQYRSMVIEPLLSRRSGQPYYRMIPGTYRMEVEKR